MPKLGKLKGRYSSLANSRHDIRASQFIQVFGTEETPWAHVVMNAISKLG